MTVGFTILLVSSNDISSNGVSGCMECRTSFRACRWSAVSIGYRKDSGRWVIVASFSWWATRTTAPLTLPSLPGTISSILLLLVENFPQFSWLRNFFSQLQPCINDADRSPGRENSDIAPPSIVNKTEGVDLCSCFSVVYQEREIVPQG